MISVLVLLLIIVAVGSLPAWPHARTWGPWPSGAIGLIALILLIWVLLGTRLG